ncbi:Major facilitator superfamily [Trypanosoma melophagium]|uniref:Major facilitator superfamily n=1 Tax=Trypanosoma melophagium TaxID=715481 RepID=UPI00351A1C08|nr:Major facilitator superfamily [Trypanosoma melophagium]
MLKGYTGMRFIHVFVVLWITYATYTMGRRPFSVARADIQRDTGLTAAQTSIVDTVFTVTYTVGQLGYGYIKKDLGNKEILLYGILLSSLSSMLLAFSSSLLFFCLAWALNGFAQAAGWATCLSILNYWIFPQERGRVMGWWSTNMAVGGVVGNVLPAFLIGQGFSWRLAVSLEAMVLIVVGGIIFFSLIQHPNMVRLPSVQQLEEEIVTAEFLQEIEYLRLNKDGEIRSPMRSLVSTDSIPVQRIKNGSSNERISIDNNAYASSLTFCQITLIPGVGGICLSYFLHKLVRYGFMFWLPYFAVEELKYSTESAGYVASFFDIGGVIGTIASGFCSDWLFRGKGRTRVILLFTLGMIITTWSFGAFSHIFVESVTLCTVAVAGVGFFSFAIDALMSGSFLLDFLENAQLTGQSGAITGVVGGMGSAGSIFQGIFTVVLSSSSWSTLFYSFSLASTVASLCLIHPLESELRNRQGTFSYV